MIIMINGYSTNISLYFEMEFPLPWGQCNGLQAAGLLIDTAFNFCEKFWGKDFQVYAGSEGVTGTIVDSICFIGALWILWGNLF